VAALAVAALGAFPVAAATLCLPACKPVTPPGTFPAPDAWGPLDGPGGPVAAFAAADLFQACAYLTGGPEDQDHHNFVTMWNGWLVLPWAPEWSNGGLSLFDVSDPCNPVVHGEGFAPLMRETHEMGFSTLGGDWAAVDALLGVQFWDLSDPAAPVAVANLDLPGVFYPDAYARAVESVFWQGPYLYASGADNGVYIIDARDPTAPVLAGQYTFDPPLRVGAFEVVGNLAMATTMEGSRVVLVDLSDPLLPEPLPGGTFDVHDAAGDARSYYFATIADHYAVFTRNGSGGGPVIYDLSDPSAPAFVADYFQPDGDGGYPYLHEQFLFAGDSNFAAVYDLADPSAPLELGRALLQGDMDTAVPVGNVLVLSVDDGAAPGQSSAVIPWARDPDVRGPRVGFAWPRDGATFQALTTRVGIVFDEMVESRSVFAGSLRVAKADGTPVAGWFNAQEAIVNFTPAAPLARDTTYVVRVMAGGIVDFNGNPTDETFELRFSTGAEVEGL
jgi:hypothetical protein